MVKKIIYLLIISLLFIQTANANSWKKINNSKFKDVIMEIKEDAIHRVNNYVLYTVHFKNKDIGDYINVICTDCANFSSNIILTTEYDKNFAPIYETYKINYLNLQPIGNNTMLYNAAVYACTSKESYNKSEKTGDSKVKKVVKSIGKCIGTILMLPFALLEALFQA